jgi:hypothetical protein
MVAVFSFGDDFVIVAKPGFLPRLFKGLCIKPETAA